ncbi:MAG TPA: PLDc N-terminal domain-containing protein [Candidatus Limnocylindrales bacterium]
MDFWDVFWLLLIFIPLLLIWTFAIIDIFQRQDMTGWLRAVWLLVVLLLPFLGTLIYLIFRPADVTPDRALDMLSDMHERGTLDDEQYADEMARLLGGRLPGNPGRNGP